MKELSINHSVFEVDEEATRAYYASMSPCSCPSCQNYAVEIRQTAPEFANALAQFGVDVRYPVENECYDLPDKTVCYLPHYTVIGKILRDEQEDLRLGNICAIACKKIKHKTAEKNQFVLTVYCVKHVPWGVDMPFEEVFPPEQKPFFRRIFKHEPRKKLS